MEDNLNYLENGRQPHFFGKWKPTATFFYRIKMTGQGAERFMFLVISDIQFTVSSLLSRTHSIPGQGTRASQELARYVDHPQAPPQQLPLQSDQFGGLHLFHVSAVDDGDGRLVVRPYCEALAGVVEPTAH